MKVIHLLCCAALLLSRYSCWAIMLEQPLAMAAEVGSTVNLSCHLNVGEQTVDRVNIYWFLQELHKSTRQYLYPESTEASIVKKNSVQISNPKHGTDMSLTVTDVQLSYSGIYVCHASILINSKNYGVTGNGTYVVVHEPLEIISNSSDVTCRIKVHEVGNVSLVWKTEANEFWKSETADSGENGLWIVNRLPDEARRCNVTASCLLLYAGMVLVNRSTEISCSDKQEAPQPFHLYGLILGSSFLILIILLTICLIKRRKYRKDTTYAQYTNVHNIKKFRKV